MKFNVKVSLLKFERAKSLFKHFFETAFGSDDAWYLWLQSTNWCNQAKKSKAIVDFAITVIIYKYNFFLSNFIY